MEQKFRDFSELPLTLTVEEVAKVLRISRGTAYNLVHREDFPAVKIGRRLIIPRDHFWSWVNKEAQGNNYN